MNLKQFDLYGWNALKGQKLLAQGVLGSYLHGPSFLLKTVKKVLFSHLRLNLLCFVGSYY